MTNQQFYNAPELAKAREIRSWGGAMTEEEKERSRQWKLNHPEILAAQKKRHAEEMQRLRDLPEYTGEGYYVTWR